VEKSLSTIQQLEKEISLKNEQIIKLSNDQFSFIQEQKEFEKCKKQFEFQVDFFTKRLEEEMLLNEQKDQVIQEFEKALLLIREEKKNMQQIAQEISQQNELLHRRIYELEKKESIINNTKFSNTTMMTTMTTATTSSSNSSSSSSSSSRKTTSYTSQEMADQVNRLYLDHTTTTVGLPPHKVAFSIRAHATEVNSICFNQSGKVIFSASSDGTVRAWDLLSKGRAIGEYRPLGTSQPLICVRVSENGEMVLGTGCDRKCFIWRVGPGRVIQTLTGHKGKVLTGDFFFTTQNSCQVITGASDRSMRVWDLSRGKSLQTINCRSSCNDIALASGGSGGTQFASAHQDGAVRFWDQRNRNMVHEMTNLHTDQVTCVSFATEESGTSSISGGNLLTNSRDHTLKLIDPRMFKTLQEFSHPNYQTGFDWSKTCLSPDGLYACGGSSNGSIFVWNTITSKLEKELTMGHQGSIACTLWRSTASADGQQQQIASCDKNGFLVLWEAS
jgi:autophagy-related protein 16